MSRTIVLTILASLLFVESVEAQLFRGLRSPSVRVARVNLPMRAFPVRAFPARVQRQQPAECYSAIPNATRLQAGSVYLPQRTAWTSNTPQNFATQTVGAMGQVVQFPTGSESYPMAQVPTGNSTPVFTAQPTYPAPTATPYGDMTTPQTIIGPNGAQHLNHLAPAYLPNTPNYVAPGYSTEGVSVIPGDGGIVVDGRADSAAEFSLQNPVPVPQQSPVPAALANPDSGADQGDSLGAPGKVESESSGQLSPTPHEQDDAPSIDIEQGTELNSVVDKF